MGALEVLGKLFKEYETYLIQIKLVVGNGIDDDKWIGDSPLHDGILHLYRLFTDKNVQSTLMCTFLPFQYRVGTSIF